MITIDIAGLTRLLNLTVVNNNSILIRSKPGRGVIAAIKEVYPNIACIVASAMSEVFQEAQVAAFIRQHPGKPVLLDLDMPECVIAPQLDAYLLRHLANDGSLIIVCQGEVTMSQPMLNRMIITAIK